MLEEGKADLISKLNGKNKIKGINSTVAILRYGAEVLESKADKLNKLDGRTWISSQCIQGTTQKVMQTEIILAEKREKEEW